MDPSTIPAGRLDHALDEQPEVGGQTKGGGKSGGDRRDRPRGRAGGKGTRRGGKGNDQEGDVDMALRRAPETAEQFQDQLTEALARLSLRNSRDLRDLTAVCCIVYLLPHTHALGEEMLEVGRWYGAETRSEGRGHTLGPPDIHRWKALLTRLAQLLEGRRGSERSTTLAGVREAKQWTDRTMAEDGGNDEMPNQIPCCRLQRTFNQTASSKLLIGVPHFSALSRWVRVIDSGIIATGIRRLPGRGPPVGLERQVHNLIKDGRDHGWLR